MCLYHIQAHFVLVYITILRYKSFGLSICFAKGKTRYAIKIARYVLRTRYVAFRQQEKRTDAEWHIRPILNVDISQQFMIFLKSIHVIELIAVGELSELASNP